MKNRIIYLSIIYSVIVINILKLVIQDNFDSRSLFRSSWLIAPAIGYLFSFKSALKVRYIDINRAILFFLIYVLFHAVIIGYQRGISVGAASFLSWGVWIGLFIYLSNEDVKKDWFDFLLMLFLIVGLVQSITVLFEYFSSNPIFKATTYLGVTRHYGIGQSVSVTGIQIGTGLIACFYFFKTKNTVAKIFMFVALITSIVGILLVASRGPIIYTIVALLFIARRLHRKNIVKFLGVILCMIVIYFALDYYYLDESYKNFITSALSIEDTSNQGRLGDYIDSFEIITSNFLNFLFGTGSGTSAIIPNITGASSFTNESSFIKLFFELGIVGGLLFLSVIFRIYKELYLFLKRSNSYKSIFGIGLVILITLELLMHDMIMAWVISFSFWSLLGVLLHEKKKYR